MNPTYDSLHPELHPHGVPHAWKWVGLGSIVAAVLVVMPPAQFAAADQADSPVAPLPVQAALTPYPAGVGAVSVDWDRVEAVADPGPMAVGAYGQ